MAAQPEWHVGLQRGRQTGGVEDVDTALVADERLLPTRANGRFELAIAGEHRLHERHAEHVATDADRFGQPLGVERVEHELNALGRAALQAGLNRPGLAIEQRDHQKIVGCRFVERVDDADSCPLAVHIDDCLITLQLREPGRAGPGDHGDVVTTAASQPEGEGAADFSGAQHRDFQRRIRRVFVHSKRSDAGCVLRVERVTAPPHPEVPTGTNAPNV